MHLLLAISLMILAPAPEDSLSQNPCDLPVNQATQEMLNRFLDEGPKVQAGLTVPFRKLSLADFVPVDSSYITRLCREIDSVQRLMRYLPGQSTVSAWRLGLWLIVLISYDEEQAVYSGPAGAIEILDEAFQPLYSGLIW
jgi:hypothetical protein